MNVPAERMTILPGMLRGTVAAIPSKSDAHRKLICCALANEPALLEIDQSQTGDDIAVTIGCLTALGARIVSADEKWLSVTPVPRDEHRPVEIDCGESGSTLRFLLPIIPALNREVTVHGRGKLPDRPISPLREELQKHGAMFTAPKLPLTLRGPLRGGIYQLPGNVSSQFVSGLLMALPLLEEDSEIRLTSPLESADYVRMTLDTLAQFGIQVELTQSGGYRISGGQHFQSPGRLSVEGDWSSAAFYLAAAALGAELEVTGLDETSSQPDRLVLEALRAFGCEIKRNQSGITVQSDGLSAARLSGAQSPDLVPILSIVACAAKGQTEWVNAERLRLKESDRLEAIKACITALGGIAGTTGAGLVIDGTGRLQGGMADGFSDHRIVMSAAIASLICDNPVQISGWQAVNKSYPNFFDDFRRLGGVANVQYR